MWRRTARQSEVTSDDESTVIDDKTVNVHVENWCEIQVTEQRVRVFDHSRRRALHVRHVWVHVRDVDRHHARVTDSQDVMQVTTEHVELADIRISSVRLQQRHPHDGNLEHWRIFEQQVDFNDEHHEKVEFGEYVEEPNTSADPSDEPLVIFPDDKEEGQIKACNNCSSVFIEEVTEVDDEATSFDPTTTPTAETPKQIVQPSRKRASRHLTSSVHSNSSANSNTMEVDSLHYRKIPHHQTPSPRKRRRTENKRNVPDLIQEPTMCPADLKNSWRSGSDQYRIVSISPPLSQTDDIVTSSINTQRSLETPPYQPDLRGSSKTPPYQQDLRGSSKISPYQLDLRGSSKKPPYQQDLQRSSKTPPYQQASRRSSKTPPYQLDLRRSSKTPPYQLDLQRSSKTPPYQPDLRRSQEIPPYKPDLRGSPKTPTYQQELRKSSRTPPYQQDLRRPSGRPPYHPDLRRSSETSPYQPNLRKSPKTKCYQPDILWSPEALPYQPDISWSSEPPPHRPDILKSSKTPPNQPDIFWSSEPPPHKPAILKSPKTSPYQLDILRPPQDPPYPITSRPVQDQHDTRMAFRGG